MEVESVLGKNDVDDVRWLCSLTHSQLDLLIELKRLILLRVNKIGHKFLANDFDLKMLRRLCFVMVNELKERVKGLPFASEFHCNLLNEEPDGDFRSLGVEDLYQYTLSGTKLKIAKMFFQDSMPTLEPFTKGKRKRKRN